ncbi:head-tail adaptor protein [Roseovarius sp. B08]|uniref:head-tail adaptor protein n=1 Tax=Roseovarius sp. B08 TaxID=3449223 RepID=UPI003EDC629D
MNANDLNRQLLLQEAERAPDGAGGFSEAWVTLGNLWANIRAGSGREASGEAASVSKTSFRITVRAAPFGAPSRPKPGQRFRDGARVFAIEAVAERDPGARFLTCYCTEEVAT